jgi:site-specific recombinase XerD
VLDERHLPLKIHRQIALKITHLRRRHVSPGRDSIVIAGTSRGRCGQVTNTPIAATVAEFLTDLTRAGKSANTVRTYRNDLARFFTGPIDQITAGVLRQYLASVADKAPATRARREAALASLLAWAYRAEIITADLMTRLDRTRPPLSPARPVPTEHIEAVLRAIPQTRDRDRLLFRLLHTTGMRIGELWPSRSMISTSAVTTSTSPC